MPADTWYAEFAAREAHGVSPVYERLARAVATDVELLAMIGALPAARQQPNLIFAVVRLLGGPVGDPAAFHDFTVTHWPAVVVESGSRG